VTGASQGIGRSTAVRLARDFKSVVLVARNRANLQETAAAVAAAHATPLIVDLDLQGCQGFGGVHVGQFGTVSTGRRFTA
jgi:short-subunit dehydrogenase